MTAKEFVKSKIPKARAEKHTSGRIKGLQETYWLIREGRQTMYLASGKTESDAWKSAKENLLKKEVRIQAMEWWNNISSLGKTQLCDTNTDIIGSIRRHETLTGSEIEKLFLNKHNTNY